MNSYLSFCCTKMCSLVSTQKNSELHFNSLHHRCPSYMTSLSTNISWIDKSQCGPWKCVGSTFDQECWKRKGQIIGSIINKSGKCLPFKVLFLTRLLELFSRLCSCNQWLFFLAHCLQRMIWRDHIKFWKLLMRIFFLHYFSKTLLLLFQTGIYWMQSRVLTVTIKSGHRFIRFPTISQRFMLKDITLMTLDTFPHNGTLKNVEKRVLHWVISRFLQTVSTLQCSGTSYSMV